MPESPSIEPAGGDEHFMRVALELAQRGRGSVEPNPMVGCVLVRDEAPIAQGYHRQFGGPHAEIDALNSLDSLADARGATAYVSLEPCCHQGKTPPCTKALIDAGIARVVIAMEDPFQRVDGGGIRQLSEAGVDTTVGVLADQAALLNAPYLKRVRTGKPWVIAKWAMTVDGRIATSTGQSQWITGEASRAQVHRLRSRVDAIAVGMGTVQSDDPMLTARLESQQAPPRIAARVVFCRHRLPSLESKLVQSASEFPLLLVVGKSINPDDLQPLTDRGADVVVTKTEDEAQMVQIALDKLGESMTNVLVEGGSELLASFLAAGQIDECHLFIGPKIFGGKSAPGPIGGSGVDEITTARSWDLVSVDQFDDDLRVVYRSRSG